MPFLTTPTSSRDLPWMDVRYTSYARTRTHAHTATQKSATSHLMDLKKKEKDSSQVDLWMGGTACRKRDRGPEDRTGQRSGTEKITEMPS